jgi:hypothetical protein
MDFPEGADLSHARVVFCSPVADFHPVDLKK